MIPNSNHFTGRTKNPCKSFNKKKKKKVKRVHENKYKK